jgi:hypothetical protein
MKMAISYASEAIYKSNILGPQFSPIIQGIKYMSNYMSLTPELYEFGGELMEKYGGKIPVNLIKASEWYWLGGNKRKARFCSKKAIKYMKSARDNGYGTFF